MINSFLSGSYLEHLKRKCISSSTSPELHCWQSLWCRGIPWYLPNSICKWWEETLNLHTHTHTELKVPNQFQILFTTEASFHFCICLKFPIRAVIHLFFPQSQKMFPETFDHIFFWCFFFIYQTVTNFIQKNVSMWVEIPAWPRYFFFV